jgi:monofunctional chorismate mutase
MMNSFEEDDLRGDKMKDIERLRSEIDDIDSKLIELFEQRMEISLSIAKYKKEMNIDVLNASREQEVISRGESMLYNKTLKVSLHKFLNCIMEISKEVQNEVLCSTLKIVKSESEKVI